jgi:hypothetical protein
MIFDKSGACQMENKFSLSATLLTVLASMILSTEVNAASPSAGDFPLQQTGQVAKEFNPVETFLENPEESLRRVRENQQDLGWPPNVDPEADPVTGSLTPPYQEPSHFGKKIEEAWKTTKEKIQAFFGVTTQQADAK